MSELYLGRKLVALVLLPGASRFPCNSSFTGGLDIVLCLRTRAGSSSCSEPGSTVLGEALAAAGTPALSGFSVGEFFVGVGILDRRAPLS